MLALMYSSLQQAYAADDPRAIPNNKIGIHILFPAEITAAATLVNSNGGDWGYVTIPIQSGDKDIIKWQLFMDSAKQNHVIPILRLATEGDYFNTKVWRKPTYLDILDFANFLDSLSWPTKNRYIVVYNEVNRADEWGGSASPQEYADILSFAASIFKSKSSQYFIISAGLDNAAPDNADQYVNEYEFLQEMDDAIPGIFTQIDGMASHSYPNPGFSQAPNLYSRMGINSFYYEQQLVKNISGKDLPVFITETGWSKHGVSDATRAQYLDQALSSFWNDTDVVAVTPFLLEAGGDPFGQFSFIDQTGKTTMQYALLASIPKVKGAPALSGKILSAAIIQAHFLPFRNFPQDRFAEKKFHGTVVARDVFNWLFGL